MASQWTHRLLCMLLVLAAWCAAPAAGITHTMVCVCRCCYLGDCKPMVNGTFPTHTCDDCTRENCITWTAEAGATQCSANVNTFINPECYNRDAFFPKMTCFVLIGCLTGLVVFGIAKRHVPMLAAINAKHFNY